MAKFIGPSLEAETPAGVLDPVVTTLVADVTYERIARTNLCTNPNLEVDAIGWGAPFNTLDTGARDTSKSYLGAASYKANRTGVYADLRFARFTTGNVLAVGSYTVSAWVYADAPLGGVYINVESYSGSVVTTVSGSTTTSGGISNAWVRIRVNVNVTTAGHVYINFNSGTTAVGSSYFDALLIEQSSVLNDYFDGATPDTSTASYVWTGAANASTSIETPPNYGAANGVATLGADGLVPAAQSRGGSNMGTPISTANNGTPSSGTTETRDAVMGNYIFTAVAGRRYEVRLNGAQFAGSVGADQFLANIRNGGSFTPTAASTLISGQRFIVATVGFPMPIYVAGTFVPGAGVQTLSVFTVRTAGTGYVTPYSGTISRELYVVDMGPV